MATIRRVLGPDFPLIFRMAGRHHVEGGREIEESVLIAKKFEKAGVNGLHVDAGCYEVKHGALPIYMDRGCSVECASVVGDAVQIPVIAVGRLGYPELSEKLLAEGKADFIALGRTLLADPQWPDKVQEGRLEDIRPCIGDYEGCLGRIVKGKTIGCTVNPQTGMERAFTMKVTPEKKSVLVIGGGPGGMDGGRVAALRGQRVTLWEREGRLGGNLIPTSVPEFKADIKGLIAYFTRQLEAARVRVRLNQEATAELVMKEKAMKSLSQPAQHPCSPHFPVHMKNRSSRPSICI